ncbi:hypothetical protein ACQP1K_05105 [Sphaerimonospora sp. CA-214678]|uniref:hypothetical protein n=1 Tax=Sphaerimonospora sp. CA-214678 TaxID=3240029 RepID=UPI003D8F586E
MTPALATPAYAQAPAAKPVIALKKQFVTGHGVRFTSVSKIDMGGLASVKLRSKGTVGFGRTGVTASDITLKADWGGLLDDDEELEGIDEPIRTITVKKTTYSSGHLFDAFLPEGKTWLRSPGGDPARELSGSFLINPLDPNTLRTVLSTTRATGRGGVVGGAKTTLYRGTITMKQLLSASPTTRKQLNGMSAKERASRVSWKLWLGTDNLVRRITTSTRETVKIKKTSIQMALTSDARFTGWGKKIKVTPPPADQVTDLSDTDGEVPQTPQIFDLNRGLGH